MQMPGMLEESRSRVFAGSPCWLRGNCGHRIHWALTEIDMAGRHRSRTARWVQRILLGDLLRVACNLSATLSGRRDRGRRKRSATGRHHDSRAGVHAAIQIDHIRIQHPNATAR
jgi:hypothetical protein